MQDNPVVVNCGTCPENKERANKVGFFKIPSHHCRLMIDFSYPEGKLILNPNVVPGWCPLAVQ